MIGTKDFLCSIIARALSAFLDVDPKEVETNFLAAGDKGLTLQHAAVKTRRIRVRSRGGISTFLVLSGSLEELAISWSWSSSLRIVEKSLLAVKGLRLQARFEFEKDAIDETKNTVTHKRPVVLYLKNLWKDAVQHVKNSQKLHQAISDLVDTLSIEVQDVQFQLILPDHDDTDGAAASEKTKLKLSFDSANFDSLQKTDPSGPIDFLRRPLNIDFSINALSLKAMEGHEEISILDPFTYAASIRRLASVRFTSLATGFEVMGREVRTRENAAKSNTNSGIFLHLSEKGVSVLGVAVSLLHGGKDVDLSEEKSISSHSSHSRGEPHERSIWLVRVLMMLVLLVVGANSVVSRGYVAADRDSMLWAASASAVTILFGWRFLQRSKGKIRKVSRSKPKKVTSGGPAMFRIPLPFITAVGPKGISITLSKISVVGRLDWEVINIAADSLSCCGGDRAEDSLRASAKGIRSSLSQNTVILNIDTISELFYPGRMNLMQPIMYTVVRLEDGVLTTKLQTLDFQMLAAKKKAKKDDDDSSHDDPSHDNSSDELQDPLSELGSRIGSFVQMTRDQVRVTSHQINKGIFRGMQGIGDLTGLKNTDESTMEPADAKELGNQISRAQLNSELFARIMTLKAVAEMFESIPLSKNRYRLRIFRNSFRGNEAVDYLLASKIAGDRLEATKVLRDLEIQFCLFEHVTKEYNFRDDHEAVFHFVDERRRRMWDISSVPFKYTEVDQEKVKQILPFSSKAFVRELVIRSQPDGEAFLCLRGSEIYANPAKLAHACVCDIFVASFENKMVSVSNMRVRGAIDPNLLREVHGLEVSVDRLHGSPEYTAEDWYEKLGFVGSAEDDSVPSKRTEKAAPFSLPYMYVAPFKFQLSWKGVVFAAKETTMSIEAYSGDGEATSNDLISYFVKRVLSRAPGLLGNFRFFGVNVMEKSGIGTALAVGAKFVPFGQYLSIGGLALFDGVTAALDNGKTARNDDDGNYKPGDFVRGVIFSAREAARYGAHARGKVKDEFYDEEDEVKLDALDFAVGATSGTAKYVYGNKSRFAGATVASASVVALTVATGPIAGLILGVACGILAEKSVKQF